MTALTRIEPPKEYWRDKIHKAVTQGINNFTLGFGGFALELIVPSDFDQRKQAFYRDVAEGLNRLHEPGGLTAKALSATSSSFPTTPQPLSRRSARTKRKSGRP